MALREVFVVVPTEFPPLSVWESELFDEEQFAIAVARQHFEQPRAVYARPLGEVRSYPPPPPAPAVRAVTDCAAPLPEFGPRPRWWYLPSAEARKGFKLYFRARVGEGWPLS